MHTCIVIYIYIERERDVYIIILIIIIVYMHISYITILQGLLGAAAEHAWGIPTVLTVSGYCLDIPRFEESLNDYKEK